MSSVWAPASLPALRQYSLAATGVRAIEDIADLLRASEGTLVLCGAANSRRR